MDETVPFIAATALNRFILDSIVIRKLNKINFLELNEVTLFKVLNLDVDLATNGDNLVQNFLTANAIYIKMTNLNIRNVKSLTSIIQIEGLSAKSSSLRIMNSTFQNNRLLVQTKYQLNTAIISIQEEIEGKLLLDNLQFIDTTLEIKKIPTSGFSLAPNLVIKSQRQNVKIKNSLFKGSVVDISVDNFNGTKDALVSGFSTLFGLNIWVFVKNLKIDSCRFVTPLFLLPLTEFHQARSH